MQLILKPSKIAGVGVFTLRSFKKGESLDGYLFECGDQKFVRKLTNPYHKRYGVQDKKGWWIPRDFRRMSIGWYLNSSKKPNLDAKWFIALRDIKKGEELTIDYRKL